eukprot:CAMPEP_0175494874 /NCGR_PEP_ID=MMETSP0096-20121207/3505_1 /TAXON_ID=311494 /ORGANISM="Alexandrium monilatum, Strain CCMP3105" /LENGTH=76 /DNA_ID=CAMNT_0016796847 /DNA_START=644 /DNA_END=871 /DNA_ORIENTATION=+
MASRVQASHGVDEAAVHLPRPEVHVHVAGIDAAGGAGAPGAHVEDLAPVSLPSELLLEVRQGYVGVPQRRRGRTPF